ncbi:MAG: hypothetical protein E7390_05520, partial [Ruminococcaceae bacterium]|nr:hypothetical protein [Oscillospiraceae bacterium]
MVRIHPPPPEKNPCRAARVFSTDSAAEKPARWTDTSVLILKIGTMCSGVRWKHCSFFMTWRIRMNVKKFFLIFTLILLAALAAFAGVVVGFVSSKPFALGEHGDALAPVGPDGIVNFLLVGKDHVGENTDVIMVISLNPNAKKISILSVPRDTRVELSGGRKINSVYSYADARGWKKEETLIETVS